MVIAGKIWLTVKLGDFVSVACFRNDWVIIGLILEWILGYFE